MLFFIDNYVVPLAFSQLLADCHDDAYKLQTLFAQLMATFQQSGISHQGLFLNADARFENKSIRADFAQRDVQANIAKNKRIKQFEKGDDTSLLSRFTKLAT